MVYQENDKSNNNVFFMLVVSFYPNGFKLGFFLSISFPKWQYTIRNFVLFSIVL